MDDAALESAALDDAFDRCRRVGADLALLEIYARLEDQYAAVVGRYSPAYRAGMPWPWMTEDGEMPAELFWGFMANLLWRTMRED